MRLRDIITESYLSELIVAVQDILTSISAQDIENIKIKDFQKLLTKQGFTTSEPELVQAIEQSGFATVDGDGESITVSVGSSDTDEPFDDIPLEDPGMGDSEGLGGGLGGAGDLPGDGLGGDMGDGLEGGLGGIEDELGDIGGDAEMGGDPGASGGGIVDDEDLPENQPPEENQGNDIFSRARKNNLQKMKAKV